MQTQTQANNQKCKKIVFKYPNSKFDDCSVIYGIIIFEDLNFYKVLTGKGREYIIQKNQIVFIEDTPWDFRSKGVQ